MAGGRWVSYIYRYREGVRCENAGFIKVQRVSCASRENARIQIGVKIYKNQVCRCMVYLLYHQKKTRFLTDILVQSKERDTIVKKIELPWNNTLGDGRDIEEYDGVIFVCDDGEVLGGIWKDFEFNPDNLEVDSQNPIKASNEDVKDKNEDDVAATDNTVRNCNEQMQCMDGASFEENEELSGDELCRRMLLTYPKLPVFMDSQLIECVKIVPHDIGKLPMANWSLGVNSFLSHGYYHYRYIMMGKVNFDDRDVFVIGVPGVFGNKERYLANMFGFNVFIPVKAAEILTGKFGYWIWEIIRE